MATFVTVFAERYQILFGVIPGLFKLTRFGNKMILPVMNFQIFVCPTIPALMIIPRQHIPSLSSPLRSLQEISILVGLA